ncbi:MAG: precorrin-6y C5,15-methyltransferase (decarboxylating) subunit CbiE [Desulfonatronovibrio sp.]
MTSTDKIIHLVGCGPGSREYLTLMASEVVNKAEVVIGPQKFIDLFDCISGLTLSVNKDINHILKSVARYAEDRDVAVLVSGDPGCFSLSTLIIERFGIDKCRVIPGISSVQLGLSRLGLPWINSRVLSVHGRRTVPGVNTIFATSPCVILLGDNLGWLKPVLKGKPADWSIFLMQDLGLPTEKISTISKEPDLKQQISASSLLVAVHTE